MIGLLSVNVKALSFTASMEADKTKATAGSEIIITVKVSNLDVGENGINSFSAYLSYNKDVFETLTDSSIDGLNGWMSVYAPASGKITLEKGLFVKADEEIMQISLKLKSDLANGTQGDVKLSQIVASNGTDEISASIISTTITVGDASVIDIPGEGGTQDPPVITPENKVTNTITPTTNTITPTTNTITPPTNTIKPANNTTNTQTNNTANAIANETTGTDIPYTGSDSNALSKIIIGVIFIALAIYIKIEKMKEI